jgi:hypothetical protein
MRKILAMLFLALAASAFAGDSRSSPAVIGYLETNDRVITLYAGDKPLYTVSSKDGKRLAERISLKELSAKFPELRRVVDGACARDGRILWAGCDAFAR